MRLNETSYGTLRTPLSGTCLLREGCRIKPVFGVCSYGWVANKRKAPQEKNAGFHATVLGLGKEAWCLTSTETIRLIRDGEKWGKGVWRWGKSEIIYLSLHCHHQNDSSPFNVSVGSDGQSHKTVSTNHNLFEEKGEPKRYRTEVLPLGQTGSRRTNTRAVALWSNLLPCNPVSYSNWRGWVRPQVGRGGCIKEWWWW